MQIKKYNQKKKLFKHVTFDINLSFKKNASKLKNLPKWKSSLKILISIKLHWYF